VNRQQRVLRLATDRSVVDRVRVARERIGRLVADERAEAVDDIV
jgi:hypothetical protein